MFTDYFNQFAWNDVQADILAKTDADVRRALQQERCDLEDFKALLSPAAAPHLETMARLSQARTLKRFGRTIQMYVPLYLSNECQNICTYCAFSVDNKIKRKTLTDAEIIQEVEAIKAMGYDHILLVTGEANQTVGVPYLQHAIRLVKPYFANISLEVQPLDQADYETLIAEGLHTVLVYQETYHAAKYKNYHPKGKKSNFQYRLETPDRLGKAGIHKIGVGALIGLEDWRTDSFFTALHVHYLERTYWQTKYSISFPRLRPIEVDKSGQSQIQDFHSYMSDRELVQLICAYRVLNDTLEISISTRERESFRDNIIKLGITSMSAGSKTNPGGYAVAPESLEQFEVSDERSSVEIASMIRRHGYEPVWKDWDMAYSG
jgi:2-iminoacetate synthase